MKTLEEKDTWLNYKKFGAGVDSLRKCKGVKFDELTNTYHLSPTDNKPIEYFLASDASALVEHTRKVMYLEENDVVGFKDGVMSVHVFEPQTAEGKLNRKANRYVQR